MGGNSAIGRPAMLTRPTITMTMEITIATMGRLMKNLDMLLSLAKSPLVGQVSNLRRIGNPPADACKTVLRAPVSNRRAGCDPAPPLSVAIFCENNQAPFLDAGEGANGLGFPWLSGRTFCT